MTDRNAIKKRLKSNWGAKADSMDCMADIRLYNNTWEVFIYAMNPENEDEIQYIINTYRMPCPEVETWSLSDLVKMCEGFGLPLELDNEFRPRNVSVILKKLTELYETTRD